MTLIVTAGQEREVIQSINDVIDSKLPRIIAQDLGTDVTIPLLLGSAARPSSRETVLRLITPRLLLSAHVLCEIRER